MKPRTIYRKTFWFVLLRLLLQGLFALISVGFLYLIYLLAAKTTLKYTALAAIALWVIITLIVIPIARKFASYQLRAAHIAAVAATVKDGMVPKHVIGYGMKKVKERFPVTSTYYFVHNLVDGAVKQLQKVLVTAVGDISFVAAGFGSVDKMVHTYMRIAVGEVDDCCLAYTFMHPKQGPLQSACDGVVIYSSNWQTLMKHAAKTFFWSMLTVALLTLIPFAVAFIGFFVLQSHSIWMIPALLIAAYLATGFKRAVVDSYNMVRMVSHFYECAEEAILPQEYYDELGELSGKFKRLYKAAKREKREEKEKRQQKQREKRLKKTEEAAAAPSSTPADAKGKDNKE